MTLKWFQLPLSLLVSLFTFHMSCTSIVRSLYFRIFCFFLDHICLLNSINIKAPFSPSWIMLFSLSLGIVFALVDSLMKLPYLHDLFTHSGACSYQCSMSNFTQCSTKSIMSNYCSIASIRHADMMHSTLSSNSLQILHLL